MTMQVTCSCGQKLKINDEDAGRTFRCPKCQKHFTAPAPEVITVNGNLQDEELLERLTKRADKSLLFGIFGLVLYIILTIIAAIIGQNRDGEQPPTIVAFIFLFGIFAAVTFSILAIVFGVKGRKIENTQNRSTGTVGMILGIIDACLGACCLGMVGIGVLAAMSKILGQ